MYLAVTTPVVQGLAQLCIQLAPSQQHLFIGLEVYIGQEGRKHKGLLCGVITWQATKAVLLTPQLLPMWAFLELYRNLN